MINWEKFNEYLGYFDVSFIVEDLIGTFFNNYPGQIANLRKNVIDRDFPQLDINAHTLKTNCATFGDLEAAKYAFNLELMGKNKVDSNAHLVNTEEWRKLEKYGKNRVDDDITVVFDQLFAATEKLIAELELYCKRHSA